jgi:DNA-directed RNA polymerase
VLYRLIRAAIRTEAVDHGSGDPPLRSTIATQLGTDLLGLDAETDRLIGVGNGLLNAADAVHAIESVSDRGHRVRINDDLFNFVAEIVNGAKRSIFERYPTQPPTGVRTKPRREMLIERPPVPPRVGEAINKIQGTPWRINKPVLARLDTREETLRVFNEITDHKEAIRKVAVRQLVLSEATALADLGRFFISAHLDFRGRIYQDSVLLTYTSGGDDVRGLLEFADGEVLDDNGRGWLAWHAAQMWGTRKDREIDPAPHLPFGHAWDLDDLDDDQSWVDAAIAHTDRWRDAEKPVQFLAAALALADARAGLPVHLPVRVDATCSALQHLSLLARDTELAKMVNLWGEEMELVEPPLQDFYQRVADATHFTRKEVKPIVVRTLYGAGDNPGGELQHRRTLSKALARTRRGGRARVRRQDQLDVKLIQLEARKLAPGAFRVLEWFKRVAEAHTAAGPLEIRWTTPSGFEAVQDYRFVDKNPERPERRVRVPINGHTVNLVKRFYTDRLDTRKQERALPANLVHSMDGSLLAELVARTKIQHWAVAHDAFGVPANRMWDLLWANREAIRDAYMGDRLAEWTRAWRADGIDVPDPPEHSEALPQEMLRGRRALG